MNYDLALKLKDVGFPQTPHTSEQMESVLDEGFAYYPTLSELIKACNPVMADDFGIHTDGDIWSTYYTYSGYFEHNNKFKQIDGMYLVDLKEHGSTPDISIANLYIALHGDKNTEKETTSI